MIKNQGEKKLITIISVTAKKLPASLYFIITVIYLPGLDKTTIQEKNL
jgi:hypothetical protein